MANQHLKAFLGIVSAAPVLFLVGLAVSIGIFVLWPIPLAHGMLATNILTVIGAVLIILGTILAFVAQRISRVVTSPDNKATVQSLMQGPYKYSRHPGSLAIGMMYLGFVLVLNSFILIFVAGFFLVLMTFVITPMEEKVIEELCPDAYRQYKTKVRMWI
jgi:protein-S-isoprenylcysteine O-methyltransferase Ste14